MLFEINSQNVLKLTRIYDLSLYTLRQVKINIFGSPTIFKIIANKVPVGEDGVLGSELFQDNNVNKGFPNKGDMF